jgi:hypothetical protein
MLSRRVVAPIADLPSEYQTCSLSLFIWLEYDATGIFCMGFMRSIHECMH